VLILFLLFASCYSLNVLLAPIWAYWTAARTIYALTDRRLLIIVSKLSPDYSCMFMAACFRASLASSFRLRDAVERSGC